MYTISKVVDMKKIDFCVWHIVFQMDGNPLEYATDFLYLLKEEKWVVNSLVTHELASLMEGYECIYCRENKIACAAACEEFSLIKKEIINNSAFHTQVEKDLREEELKYKSADLLIVNNRSQWEEMAQENRFYGAMLKLKNANK